VVIPERDAPAMLAEALASLAAAFHEVTEPRQIVVVANGAAPSTYDGVKARFPAVEWVHSEPSLGFAEAVKHGLARVRFGATYLMNNDMTLEPRALAALLPLRGDGLHRLVRQPRRHPPVSRAAAAGNRTASLREWRRGAVPHGPPRPLPAREPRLRPVLLGGRRVER